MAEVTMTDEQQVLIHAVPQTAAGNVGAVEGQVEFSVASGACTLGEQPGPTSIWVVSGNDPGDSVIHLRGDADLGAGIQHIEDDVTVHVLQALAVAFSITADAPILK